MTKRALPLLTGGLNEITRSDLIDDSQLQKCQNYEIEGNGTLVKRTEPETFSDSLDNLLSSLYSSVISISEPWYPQTLQSYSGESRSDYFLFAYGLTSAGNYELHILWDKNGTWVQYVENTNGTDDGATLSSLLTSANIIYTSESEVEINIGSDKIIITDGVNRAHFVAIDKDGNHRSGIMGIPAPTNKATITEMTEWEDSLWENDSTASYLSTPGLFQCVYTVVTKFGEESNPSPLSDTLDMQFFKLDVDGLDERWLEKVEIKNLSIPDLPDNILEDLKYFKIYMRVIKYAGGESTATLEFTERFEIVSKKDSSGNVLTSGVTGNNYTLTIEPTAGDMASWENDIAPIAKTGAEVGGITMLGNVKTKIGFPWEFKYYHPITINNGDSKSYVDAIIKIRLWDKDATGTDTDAIENFIVTDFISSNLYTKRENHIRIFDQDLTTPIMICYNGFNNSDDVNIDGNNNYIDLYIKIPLLTAASSHIVYLCWTPFADEEDYTGVPEAYSGTTGYDFTWSGNIGIHYGQFMIIGVHGWIRQQVFTGERVTSSNSILCTPMNVIMQDDRIGNKANMKYSGTINSNVSIDSGTTIIPILSDTYSTGMPSNKVMFNTTGNSEVSFGTLGVGDTIKGKYLTIYGRIKYDASDNDFDYAKTIFRINGDFDSSFQIVDTSAANIDQPNMKWKLGSNAGITEYFENIDDPADTGEPGYFFLFSINDGAGDEDSMMSLFIINLGTGTYGYEEINQTVENILSNITEFTLGEDLEGYDYSFKDAEYSQLQMIRYKYYSATNDDDISAIYNIASFMPAYDEIIGHKYSDTSHNNKIVFGETKEIKFKEYKNMLKWTDVNYTSFPDLFYKRVREPVLRIMPAPSFLQFEYQNTFIIFTRNSINRFVLEGSASGWSGSSSSLIEEKTQYGLLAPESLVRAGGALFWVSEVGEMMWTSEGLRLISKDIVDIPIEEDVIGFYNNLKNQYILHKPTISYDVSFPYGTARTIEDYNGLGYSVLQFAASGIDFNALGIHKGMKIILRDFDWIPGQDQIDGSDQTPSSGDDSGEYIVDQAYGGFILFDSVVLTNHIYTDNRTLYIEFGTYVYQIDRNAWSEYRGLDIVSSSGLTGGTQLDNINLFLGSDGAIKKYPTSTTTSVESLIQTKEMFFEKGTLRRIKASFDGSGVDFISYLKKNDYNGQEILKTNTLASLESDKWRGIELGYNRGKSVSFAIKNAERIKKIMYDLNIESEVLI